jgi:GTPase involved in cell partitioning and DNA repair
MDAGWPEQGDPDGGGGGASGIIYVQKINILSDLTILFETPTFARSRHAR